MLPNNFNVLFDKLKCILRQQQFVEQVCNCKKAPHRTKGAKIILMEFRVRRYNAQPFFPQWKWQVSNLDCTLIVKFSLFCAVTSRRRRERLTRLFI